jgi:anti-anti-sigma regulatory factor
MRVKERSRKQVRVTIDQGDSDQVTMKIEGKIAGPHVSALRRAWQELADSLRGRKFRVDLRDVMHVDGSGGRLLAKMHQETGAEFVADTPLTKYFAESAKQGIPAGSEY